MEGRVKSVDQLEQLRLQMYSPRWLTTRPRSLHYTDTLGWLQPDPQ